MVYTKEEQLNIAIKIAVDSHYTQKDKNGIPYIFHPLKVMSKFDDIPHRIVSILHDVIEDTNVTPDYLIQAGIDPEYVNSVIAISRNPEETYFDYINRCKKDTIAKNVKIEDLNHNLSKERMMDNEKLIKLSKRYKKALEILTEIDNMEIDITGIDKAVILAELYNNSKPLGKGILQYRKGNMTIEQARNILNIRTSFDYLYGRIMKINIDGNTIDPYLYDRDNGEGSVEKIINNIKKKV